jgi:hypothetical protein
MTGSPFTRFLTGIIAEWGANRTSAIHHAIESIDQDMHQTKAGDGVTWEHERIGFHVGRDQLAVGLSSGGILVSAT